MDFLVLLANLAARSKRQAASHLHQMGTLSIDESATSGVTR